MNKLIGGGQNKHLYWLDLLRFVAAFAVMACHFRGAFFVEYSVLPADNQGVPVFSFYFITRLGFEAVLIFFVLSGFLVGGKAINRLAEGTFKARDYAIDRFARIMLPLVASLLFFLPISLYFDIPTTLGSWIGCLLSLQGIVTKSVFAPLWSLSYEVWFYILMFAIALIWRPKSPIQSTTRKHCLGILILFLVMLVFVKLKVSYLFVWLTGAVIFAKLGEMSHRTSVIICSVSALASAVLILLLQVSSDSHYIALPGMEDTTLLRDILIVTFGLTFSIFVKLLVGFVPTRRWLISLNKIGTRLAAFSYTLYLTHAPVLRLLEGLGAPKSESVNIVSVSLYLLWMAVAMGIAYILYLLFEKHTGALKQYLKSKI